MTRLNRSLISFLLAGLTVGVLFTCFNLLSGVIFGSEGILVITSKDANVDQAVQAVGDLHLKGVHVEKISHLHWSFENVIWTVISFSIGFLIITGFVLFFYKLYCRWFDATHHL
jgi:hypothetical protein